MDAITLPVGMSPEGIAAIRAAMARGAQVPHSDNKALVYKPYDGPPLPNAISSPAKSTSSAVVTVQSAQPAAKSTEITDGYGNGSAAQENVTQATGLAQAARSNIESLNLGVNAYNNAKKTLGDSEKLAKLRAVYGDEKTNNFITVMNGVMKTGLTMLTLAQGSMKD